MKLSDYKKSYEIKVSKMNSYVDFNSPWKNEEEVIRWLQNMLTSSQIFNKNIVDTTQYEYLIFVAVKYKDNETIQLLIRQIFDQIYNNFVEKNKYILRVK